MSSSRAKGVKIIGADISLHKLLAKRRAAAYIRPPKTKRQVEESRGSRGPPIVRNTKSFNGYSRKWVPLFGHKAVFWIPVMSTGEGVGGLPGYLRTDDKGN